MRHPASRRARINRLPAGLRNSSPVRQLGDISLSRPGERGDPYAVPYGLGDGVDAFCNNQRRWLWVRAFRRDDAGEFCSQLVASIESMEMMDRPVAVADVEAIGRRNRGADPGFGIDHRGLQLVAFRKARGDGGGE